MIRFFLQLTLNVIIDNWRRMLILGVSILLLIISYHLFKVDIEPNYIPIESIFEDSGKWTYVGYGTNKYHFNSEQKIHHDKLNGNITYIKVYEPGPSFIVFLVLGIIGSVAVIVISIVEDWDVDESIRYVVNKNMKSDYQDGKWYFHSFGRLIGTDHNNNHYSRYNTIREIINSPKWESKADKRESKLEKLGI